MKGENGKRGYPGSQGVKGDPGQPFITIEGVSYEDFEEIGNYFVLFV